MNSPTAEICREYCQVNCFPDCESFSDAPSRWHCDCYDGFDWRMNCTVALSSDPALWYYYYIYWVGGLLLVVPGTVLFVVELYLHFRFHTAAARLDGAAVGMVEGLEEEPFNRLKTGKKIQSPLFYLKLLNVVSGLFRIYFFAEYGWGVIEETSPTLMLHRILSALVFWMAPVVGVICFILSTYVWINLVVSWWDTKTMKIQRYCFISILILLAVGGVVLGCVAFLRTDEVYIGSQVWLGSAVVITTSLSLPQIYKLHSVLPNMSGRTKQRVYRKNIALFLINLFLLLTAATLIIKHSKWSLVGDAHYPLSQEVIIPIIIRLQEIVVYYLFFYFSESFCSYRLARICNGSNSIEFSNYY